MAIYNLGPVTESAPKPPAFVCSPIKLRSSLTKGTVYTRESPREQVGPGTSEEEATRPVFQELPSYCEGHGFSQRAEGQISLGSEKAGGWEGIWCKILPLRWLGMRGNGVGGLLCLSSLLPASCPLRMPQIQGTAAEGEGWEE